MKIEAKLFELLTVFFIIVGIIYVVFTNISRAGLEWVGITAIALSAGLTLIVGTYFRFVARRIDTRPEDYDEADIQDGSGDLGFFPPHSFWPLLLGLAAAVTAVGFAFVQWWVVAAGVVAILVATAGLVFEYHLGPEQH
ncbi:cytochrome c oxidase subunit 4 [Hoyosella altamirensis]|uniref:Cytochrome c oxidase polypeptide 4 n=1 Tax=Hoyosella altamirensis TaxID=616997 RepID=A0A839RRS8_9ACTN|nr:cytochrome c oxidase subunit 4 [Hoyosella altamirensis]MBB3038918.1 divalent metal cation (Fe/Co/Zn/Cd) transporter [Hoyosella altamirensis]